MSNMKAPLPQCAAMVRVQNILSGKWKITILWYIAEYEVQRFGELRRRLGDITQSTLTKQLRELEQDGFISRYIYQEVPPKVEYSLTDLGKSFRATTKPPLAQYDQLRAGLEMAGVTVLEDSAVQLERVTARRSLHRAFRPRFHAAKGDIFGEVPSMVSTKLERPAVEAATQSCSPTARNCLRLMRPAALTLSSAAMHTAASSACPLSADWLPPKSGLFPKYDAGLYTDGSTTMVVSRGIGNSIIPLRFNNRPEIVLVGALLNEYPSI